ncbi:MAG: hypothetical protein IJV65_05855, partial [Kiritimatiellae bacterium]|nr:hypothetical protein [Kiritimatiellia bacterium]
VEITGGTHVSWAPCWEFFAESYLPLVRAMDARIEREAEPDCASATLRIALAEPGGKV